MRGSFLIAGVVMAAVLPALAQMRVAEAPPAPALDGTRGPSDLAFSPDGKLCYVTEQDEGQVAVLEADTGKTVARIPSGGKEPTGLAISQDGGTLVVANSFSGTVGILDAGARKLRATVPLRGGPQDVVIPRDGEAWVSVSQVDQVAVIDLATAKVAARIPTGTVVAQSGMPRPTTLPPGRRPRALAVTPDGETVLCGNFSGGSVSRLDVAGRKEVECLPLPMVNVRGVAVDPGGEIVYVTGQVPHNANPTERAEAMWSNARMALTLGRERLASGGVTILDPPAESPEPGAESAADPGAVLVSSVGRLVVVAHEGGHSLSGMEPAGRKVGSARSGANPRALAERPQTREFWVANHLGNSISVLENGTLKHLRTLELEPPTRSDIRLKGRYLFTSAHVTRGQRFTCNSCHPDGNTDGLSWQFAHMKDGIERRNTRSIRGAVLLTPPYRWSGMEIDFEDFVQDEVVGLLRSPKMAHSDLHAYWDLVNEFPLSPNPHRAANGGFTPEAKRGHALFAGKAACASCHGGSQAGGTGKKEWVGTTPPTVKVDVPHLTGVFDSAPYLHDGRAVTLEDIFRKHNAGKKHGKADLLTDAELADLLRYLREL